MLKRITAICIIAAAALFILVLVWPMKAERVASDILKGIQRMETARLPLLGYKEPALKVVDPEAINSVVTEEVPRLAALLRKGDDTGNELVVADIIDQTNKARIAEGLSPLKADPLLAASAQLKTEDMIKYHYFEHESPSGESVSDLGREVGYDYIIMGENLALGNFSGAKDLVDAWMASPGHRANILSDKYQEIGIYAAEGTYEGRRVWFAVQHFGAPRSACPAISKSLKREIDVQNTELTREQLAIEALKTKIEESNADEPGYEEDVASFNTMVGTYNQLLEVSRDKIFEYNRQVAKFNACLVQYQK